MAKAPVPSEAMPPGAQMADPSSPVAQAPVLVGSAMLMATTRPRAPLQSPTWPPKGTYRMPFTSSRAPRWLVRARSGLPPIACFTSTGQPPPRSVPSSML